MADFVSSLTGVQMDSALIDMAEHNSEAYAVGERNGVPVDSSDVTYHNNARYYASQAQSIAPASVTEAVRWDVAQTALTDANKEMARANIDAGKNGAWTNPNLLDNPFFTINQRNITTMSSASYAMDRWKCDNAVTNGMVYSDGVLTLSSTTVFAQRLEQSLFDAIKGRTVTASVILSDNTIKSETAVVNSSGTTAFTGVGSIDTSPLRFRMWNIAFKAVKLELGSVSTLANDVPPNYAEELAKCQRYFVRLDGTAASKFIGIATAYSTTSVRVFIPLPVTLRANPTITITGTFAGWRGTGQQYTVSSLSSLGQTANGLTVYGATSASNLTAGDVSFPFLTANSYIDLSADL